MMAFATSRKLSLTPLFLTYSTMRLYGAYEWQVCLLGAARLPKEFSTSPLRVLCPSSSARGPSYLLRSSAVPCLRLETSNRKWPANPCVCLPLPLALDRPSVSLRCGRHLQGHKPKLCSSYAVADTRQRHRWFPEAAAGLPVILPRSRLARHDTSWIAGHYRRQDEKPHPREERWHNLCELNAGE